MATIRNKMKDLLIHKGVLEDMAEKIMVIVQAAPENVSLVDRWNYDEEGYPVELLAGIWGSVKEHAIAWLEEHDPKAWSLKNLKGTMPEPLIIGAEPDSGKGE